MTCLKQTQNINLLVIGPLSFPYSNAANNRVTAYCKAIIENGGNAGVLCTRTAEFKASGDTKVSVSGCTEGIKYIYATDTTIRPESRLARILTETKGFLRTFAIIRRLHRQEKINAFLFYSTRFLDELFLIPFARLLRIPVIKERGEYPFRNRNSLAKKLKVYLYEKFIDSLFNGMFFTTRFLRDYFKPLMGKNAKYLVVPTLVDMARFQNVAPNETRGKYIAYCGDPSGNKDGVPILLEAFSIIADKHQDVQLYIIGDNTRHNILPKLRKDIETLNIADRVVFTGQVSRDSIPDYLCNACALVLARPSSLQSQGGFAAKVGEYLSTGNPVVLTDVGEISEFLQDGESAFIAPADSIKAFAEKLDHALANLDMARKVGLKGKEIAQNSFCYKVYGQKLIDFIRKLNTQ